MNEAATLRCPRCAHQIIFYLQTRYIQLVLDMYVEDEEMSLQEVFE